MTRTDASLAQIRAARPDRSTWLSANAGSGKTRVLTDRVARLLLEDVPPDHILCLTYTKAAASEMQNRLFQRLGAWSMLDDKDLRTALDDLGALQDGPDFLDKARTLFARAIETPGGLRIQTIHSFCAALLRRFPLEAGVSPQFTEIEDRASELLREDILDEMALGDDADLLTRVAGLISDSQLPDLTKSIVGNRGWFAQEVSEDARRVAYGLPAGLDVQSLLADVFWGDTLAFCSEVAALYLTGSPTDQTRGRTLMQVRSADVPSLIALETALLKNDKTPPKALATKGLKEGVLAPYMDRIEALAARVAAAFETRQALAAVEQDGVLQQFATRFLARYEAAKHLRGWLDFDDLIDRASLLLRDTDVANWVLFRLDGEIDHILVDEAQDTSPRQWAVIERLAQEFTSGAGARGDVTRTIFVVGDKKQSIYSFQGADAAEFDRMKSEFAERLKDQTNPLADLTLDYSFRSAPVVLRAVDATFEGRATSGFPNDGVHKAFKSAMPGRVDLWPMVDADEMPEETEWYRPVDYISPRDPSKILAQRVARQIRQLVDSEHPLPVEVGNTGIYEARPVQPGDVLILVRGRSGTLFPELIRACKQEGLPIAGADRLKVMAELAVRDILAVLSFLDTPDDSLSLAVALRSPLFGLSQQDLFDLAHKRKDDLLWTELRAQRDRFPDGFRILDDLRLKADFLRPYDLIERLLTLHDGRMRLLGRLGEEAEDGIDALLNQALSYEQTEVPSLTGFLQWAQSDDLETKRQMDSASNRIRVMTVHGAKGLEAPIVILPDCKPQTNKMTDLLLKDADGPMWKRRKNEQPARQTAEIERLKLARQQESDRLLYVAMTRAEKRLIVASVAHKDTAGTGWYTQVQNGLSRLGAQDQAFDFGDLGQGMGLTLAEGDPAALPPRALDLPQTAHAAVPEWAARPAPGGTPPATIRAPSDLGGAKAIAGEEGDETDEALARGVLIHALLEHLPNVTGAARDRLGRDMIARDTSILSDAARQASLTEALAVLDHPDLAPLFAPQHLAEVPIFNTLPGLGQVSGVIDRLVILPDRILAVDFKTNRTLPDRAEACPEGLLRQMGAYAQLLALDFPNRPIETAFLWTAAPLLMRLPHSLVIEAAARANLDARPAPA